MAQNSTINPAAPHHLPGFIASPGETDMLLVMSAIILLLAVVGVGVLYLKLHSLPEQMAHRGQKVQFQVVAVLGLLALFTHNHVFWIAALLLALVQLPDLSTPLGSMARSLSRMSGGDETVVETRRDEPAPDHGEHMVATAPEPPPAEAPPPKAPPAGGATAKTGKRSA
jgi:hypothetical protein